MLELASHIVSTKTGRFDPRKFEDQYEDALKALLKRKQSGKPIEPPARPESAQVINLMDALRKSVAAERPAARRKASGGGRRPAAHSRRGTAKRGQGRRKAG